jgi:SAM-dependent methyltransferase
MLAGLPLARSLTSSPAEWAVRNEVLAATLSSLINAYAPVRPDGRGRGLDIGCQGGALCDGLEGRTHLTWCGIDPALDAPTCSASGAELLPAWAHQTPYATGSFACVVLANVYEHVTPCLRTATLAELRRVLQDDGVLVGQLPNPFFPIESHSRLPFMGYLPTRLQAIYWRLSAVDWVRDFYVVTISDLLARATALGYAPVSVRNFNYPAEAVPGNVRWVAGLFNRAPLNRLPWAWQFVLRKRYDCR